MRIIIVGAGKVGVALTQQLSAEHQVTVIDEHAQLIDNIINVYDVMGVCGNGASYGVQKEAETDKADLLIATTSSDEINILACLVAKKLGVEHTIARIRNPDYEVQLRFMREDLGLSMAIIPPPDIVSQVMVAIPIIALYEFSILLSRLVYKAKGKKAEE